MKQHYLEQDGKVASYGWDRPLQYWFITIQDADGTLFTNMNLDNPAMSIEAIKDTLAMSGFDVPADIEDVLKTDASGSVLTFHDDLKPFAELFKYVNCTQTKDIGMRVLYMAPSCVAEWDVFTVEAVQRIFDGSFAYRVVGDMDKHRFGRVARFDAVKPADDEFEVAQYSTEYVLRLCNVISGESDE